MIERANPFATLDGVPDFKPKAARERPVANGEIDRIADENGFPSRQPPKVKEPKRKRRRYTTGRNQQFNVRASAETIERFYRMADERRTSLCALLEVALSALEEQGPCK